MLRASEERCLFINLEIINNRVTISWLKNGNRREKA